MEETQQVEITKERATIPWGQWGLMLFCTGLFVFSLADAFDRESGILFGLAGLLFAVGAPLFLFGLVRRAFYRSSRPSRQAWLDRLAVAMVMAWIAVPLLVLFSHMPTEGVVSDVSQDWQTILAVDGHSELLVPPGWRYYPEIVPQTGQVAAIDPSGDAIVAANLRHKMDIVDPTLDALADLVVRHIKDAHGEDALVMPWTRIETGRPQMELIYEHRVAELRLHCLCTIVELPDHFAVVEGFAPVSKFESFLPLLREIASTYSRSGKAQSLADMVAPGSRWEGTCSQSGFSPYPMVMTVTQVQDGKIEGILYWPTFQHTRTRFHGTLEGSTLRFVEDQYISGSGVAIPSHYEGRYASGAIRGTVTHQTETGEFEIVLSPEPQ
jgi:hypothetical protein